MGKLDGKTAIVTGGATRHRSTITPRPSREKAPWWLSSTLAVAKRLPRQSMPVSAVPPA